jgi:hypothetical protein
MSDVFRLFAVPAFTLWMGMAFVVLFVTVGVLGWALVHMLRDERGVDDSIGGPALTRTMHVRAVLSGFRGLGPARFADLRRCERFGDAPIGCDKPCLRRAGGAALAAHA